MTFILEQTRSLPEYRCTAKCYRHTCGMTVYSLETEDPENLFAVCLKTIAQDDTGVAHIIEHSVLAGSRKYPVKDPFMELWKSSMATFLNAMTYQDFTVYPVATAVPSEFFTLADVYFDAVFQPLLEKTRFQQEGWRYDFKKKTAKGVPGINGVVYNEMRGDYYEPSELLGRILDRKLFRGNPQSYISGGDPLSIPVLTYQHYLKFYREHYHPSRSMVFFYGNIPTEQKLAFLEERLAALSFTPLPAQKNPPRKWSPWKHPQTETTGYLPSSEDSNLGMWARETVLTQKHDLSLVLALKFLSSLLLTDADAPLRKAILDSKLCSGLGIHGVDSEAPESVFILSLLGVKPENFEKVTSLIEDTYRSLAKNGFPQAQVQAAFAQFKYGELIINSEFILNLMEEVCLSWTYELDPLVVLSHGTRWHDLQQKVMNNPRFLSDLIQKYLLDNPYSYTLHLLPDRTIPQKDATLLKNKMEQRAASWSPRYLKTLLKEAREYKKQENVPDTPEQLSCLPRLTRKDVPETPVPLPYADAITPQGCKFRTIEMFSNGISRLKFTVFLPELTPEELQALFDYRVFFSKLGTNAVSYDMNARRWNLLGANFSCCLINALQKKRIDERIFAMEFSITALEENFSAALELLRDQFLTVSFNDRQWIESLSRQFWTGFQEAKSASPLAFTKMRSQASLTAFSALTENGKGLSAENRFKERATHFAQCYPDMKEGFVKIAGILARSIPTHAAFLGSDANQIAAMNFLDTLGDRLHPIQTCTILDRSFQPQTSRREFFPIRGLVSACTRSYPAPDATSKEGIAISIYANLLNSGYLWDEIRVKGGAYGASASCADHGIFSVNSFQDPNPKHTSEIFDSLRTLGCPWTDQEVDNAVISALKGFHSPFRQSEVCSIGLSRLQSEVTPEDRLENHQQILQITRKDLQEQIEKFWATAPDGCQCILGPKSASRPKKEDK